MSEENKTFLVTVRNDEGVLHCYRCSSISFKTNASAPQDIDFTLGEAYKADPELEELRADAERLARLLSYWVEAGRIGNFYQVAQGVFRVALPNEYNKWMEIQASQLLSAENLLEVAIKKCKIERSRSVEPTNIPDGEAD